MSTSNPLSRVREVVVVGGGIAGCTIAYELARAGADVTLLEQDRIACAASGCNAGLLLNQVERDVVLTMQESLHTYQHLHAERDLELRRQDQLLLATRTDQAAAARARADAMREIGVVVEDLEPHALANFPQLRAEFAAGYLLRDAWALNPLKATTAIAAAARAAGARLHTGVRVNAVALREGRVAGVYTDTDQLRADAVVLATGPRLQELLPGASVTGGRGWLMRTARLGFELPWIVEEMSWPDQDELGRAARPVTLEELSSGGHDLPVVEAFVLAPQPGGDALLGTSLAPSLIDAVEGVEMPRRLAARALAAAPGLARVPVVAAWSALRPMTPDGMPVAGRAGLDNLYVHGGHGSIGMMTAPATARRLARAILWGEESPELVRLDPLRFSSREARSLA
jgi:glycine/D-amino acid oxidase-like deaminating enzyme